MQYLGLCQQQVNNNPHFKSFSFYYNMYIHVIDIYVLTMKYLLDSQNNPTNKQMSNGKKKFNMDPKKVYYHNYVFVVCIDM
jgi:hypothetical protein